MNGATTIQERLKDLRLNKGLKLEELAEQTGISKSALGSYEKDDYKEINHGNLIPRRSTEEHAQRAGLIFTEVTTHKSVVWGLVWSVAITEICQD